MTAAQKKEHVKQVNEAMGYVRSQCSKGEEVHHIFGKQYPRLKACRYFCTPLAKAKGAASHHDFTDAARKKFREDNRKDFRAFEKANHLNRDQTKCWYACCYRDVCPLYEKRP